MSNTPISNLPSNDFLPKALHSQADGWREAAKRVGAINRAAVEAAAQLKRAELEDAESLRAAVLSGKPLPAADAEANTLRARMAEAERRLPIAKAELHRLGLALASELHKPEHRAFIAAAVQDELAPAVSAYMVTMDDAEKAVSAAHAKVSAAASLISVIRAIDSGTDIAQITHSVAAPSFGAARTGAAELRAAVDALTTSRMGAPRFRRVELDDGRVVNLTAEALRSVESATDRKVVAYLDGYGDAA
ncbi:hypothetical protein [Streptomyces sp. NPDC057284]|uniref:hypothetical protein n=1 Tax=Streptomyces sp. NPDC057284 TaxID=3346083 RepID=UPI00363DA986